MSDHAPLDATIGSLSLRADEELRVTVNGFRGQQYCHVRKYYRESEGQPWRPGKGVAFRAALLAWVIASLRTLEAELLGAHGLESEDYERVGIAQPAEGRV